MDYKISDHISRYGQKVIIHKSDLGIVAEIDGDIRVYMANDHSFFGISANSLNDGLKMIGIEILF